MTAEKPENLGKQEKFKIKVFCAWCKKEMRAIEGEVETVSHGICQECRAKYFGGIPKREGE